MNSPAASAGQEPPAGLYIHIPFCKSKCQYCAFTSFPAKGFDLQGYMAGLLRQAETMARHPWCRATRFASLYLGGGTPTIYDGPILTELINRCLGLFNFSKDPEITVEANPNTVSSAKLLELKKAGVTRLSLGVQVFADRLLKKISRTHTTAEALAAIRMAREAGFDNLNIDLIYGLPGQSPVDWQESLEQAASLQPEHLAIYELMIEEGSGFAELEKAGKLDLPDEDAVTAMAEMIPDLLTPAGYLRYEISNYARNNKRSNHNINYWQNGSYLGLGAGAVSCFSGLRVSSVDDPDLFSRLVGDNRPPYKDAEALGREIAFRETVIMGLRMVEGVSRKRLQDRFDMDPAEYYGKILDELIAQGLIETNNNFLRLTDHGLALANQVLCRLV